jgi:hypothetical protein
LAPAWVKASRCPTHRLRGDDDGLPPVPLVGRTRRVGGHLAVAPQGAIAGEPGTRAPHVAVITFGGREISTIDLYGRRFVLLAGANGAAWISAAERVMQRLAYRSMYIAYIASVWSWEVLKWRPPRIASRRTTRCWSGPMASSPGIPRLPRRTQNARWDASCAACCAVHSARHRKSPKLLEQLQHDRVGIYRNAKESIGLAAHVAAIMKISRLPVELVSQC